MPGEPRDVQVSVRYMLVVVACMVLAVAGVWSWRYYHYRPVSTGGQTGNVAVVPNDDPVVLAAGDIATCGIKGSAETAALLGGTEGTILALGDEAYPSGTVQQFRECYGATWGAYLARTRPVPGNHEYLTPNAAGYFSYFGDVAGDPTKGYYSFDLGTWHIVALNSECSAVGGCGSGAPMVQWLEADLAAHRTTCTLAYWHVPRFSSAMHGSAPSLQAVWETAVTHGVDVVLNGHDHVYERFVPMDALGAPSAQGTRAFVVGTGGGNTHYNFEKVLPTSAARDNTTFGVLRLSLRVDGYDWEFLPATAGAFSDSGTGSCH